MRSLAQGRHALVNAGLIAMAAMLCVATVLILVLRYVVKEA